MGYGESFICGGLHGYGEAWEVLVCGGSHCLAVLAVLGTSHRIKADKRPAYTSQAFQNFCSFGVLPIKTVFHIILLDKPLVKHTNGQSI